ncbi:hypothetical protein MW887_010726 [Aspergillus wentii]|nr:hypothetical protein MW887_010726 [Aspergillus wentii]
MAEGPQQLSHGDYTVGWICALPHPEQTASWAMFDEVHKGLAAADSQDANCYTLGRIDGHNVVIACLPAETTGKASAASVAKDMLRSFPAVRFGLMVGIGGGAPFYGTQAVGDADSEEEDSEDETDDTRDIRLGDVVVSLHSKTSEAVVQYDFGKSIQGQDFIHTGGKLNKPPQIVLAGLGTLKTKLYMNPFLLSEGLEKALLKHPSMAKEFASPGPGKDRLFKSDFLHTVGKKSCKACCGPNNINLVQRNTRPDNSPKVHYGTIGSADQVMKDALLRDKWAEKENILCFEMEAAGLMDSFPCLVIRGTCDYADSHKSKLWQPYAALTAAVYAKALLSVIPGQSVDNLAPITELLGIVSKTEANVDMVKSMLDCKEDDEILNWITSVDYSRQQNDYFQKAQPGTGQWLLDSTEFQEWLEGSTLFCPGIPGAGKTIITSIVTNNLLKRTSGDPGIGVAYIYCNFNRKSEQKFDSLLSSLLKQLAQQQKPLHKTVKSLYKRHKAQRTRPSLDEIKNALHSVVGMYSKVFVLVDALDECQQLEGCRRRFLLELFDLQGKHRIKIFATSRPNGEISELFQEAISLEISARVHDLEIYLDERMRFQHSETYDYEIKAQIKSKIVSVTGGMFLLAALHINSVMDLLTPGDIKEALESLAEGAEALDRTYDNTMKRIEDDNKTRELSKKVLEWIFFARRPISTQELRYALAIHPGRKGLNEDFLPRLDTIQSVCAGLVTIDDESNIVRLVHYTTQEYFQRTQSQCSRKEYNQMFSTITLLAIGDITLARRQYRQYKTTTAFLILQKKAWNLSPEDMVKGVYHLLSSDGQDVEEHPGKARLAKYLIQKCMIMRLLDSEQHVSSSMQALMVGESPRRYRNYSQEPPQSTTGLHLAAKLGLNDMVAAFIRAGNDLDVKDSYGRTPLSWAAENGHGVVVTLLLETQRINLDSESKSGRTPLSFAAENGHAMVVKLLFETGKVNLESRDTFHGVTPLSWAAWRGHLDVASWLLRNTQVDPDSKSKLGQTPLSYAAQHGHEMVVMALVSNEDVDPDSRSNAGRTPLSYAAENGHDAVVQTLLTENRVDLNSKDSIYGQTPLWWAVWKGHEAIVRLLLLNHQVDVNIKDLTNNRSTPLGWAVSKRHVSIVDLLLDRDDVEVDCKDIDGRTPLSHAVLLEDQIIANALIQRGASRNTADKNGYTPLTWL